MLALKTMTEDTHNSLNKMVSIINPGYVKFIEDSN